VFSNLYCCHWNTNLCFTRVSENVPPTAQLRYL
jgi:hypothetical protein